MKLYKVKTTVWMEIYADDEDDASEEMESTIDEVFGMHSSGVYDVEEEAI